MDTFLDDSQEQFQLKSQQKLTNNQHKKTSQCQENETRTIMQQNTAECQNLAKIDFLQQEIKQLKDETQDLKKLIKLNKEQNGLLVNQLQQANTQIGLYQNQSSNTIERGIMNLPSSAQHNMITTNQNSTTRYQTASQSACKSKAIQEIQYKHDQEIKNQKYLQSLVDNLFQENEKLYSVIEKVARERDFAQGKSLINEQIALGASEHEMTIIDQLSTTIDTLQKYVKQKDEDNQKLVSQQQAIQKQYKALEKSYAMLEKNYKTLQKYFQSDSMNKTISPKGENAHLYGGMYNVSMQQNEYKQLLQSMENPGLAGVNQGDNEQPQSPQPYGTVVRYKEIFNPTKEVVKLQTRIQIYQQFLKKIVEQMERYKNEKNELMALNTFLSTDLVQTKDQLLKIQQQVPQYQTHSIHTLGNNNLNNSFQNNNNNQHDNSSLNICSKNILKTDAVDLDDIQAQMLTQQKKIVGVDEESSFEEENLPDKVIPKKQQQEISTSGNSLVPKLDIGKAQKFQDFSIKKAAQIQHQKELKMQQQQIMKQVQEQQQKYGINPTQSQTSQGSSNNIYKNQQQSLYQQPQYQQLQLEVQQLRSQELKNQEKMNKLNEEILNNKICVQQQMMLNKVLIEQADEAQRNATELEERNNILIAANQRYEERWQKVFHSLYFYREYYISDNKYFLQSKIKTKAELPLLMGPGEQFQTSVCNEYNVDDPFFSPESLVRFVKKKENSINQELKIPKLLEINHDVFEILSQRGYKTQAKDLEFEEGQEDAIKENNDNNARNNIEDLEKKQLQKDIDNLKCKNALMNMAKEIYQNEKLQKLSQNFQHQKNKKKRSKSVPNKKAIKTFYMMPLKLLKSKPDVKITRVFTTQTMSQHNKRKISRISKKDTWNNIQQSINPNTSISNNNNQGGIQYKRKNSKSQYQQATYNMQNQNQNINNNIYAEGLESPQGSGEIIYCPEGIPQKLKNWQLNMGMPTASKLQSEADSSFQGYQYQNYELGNIHFTSQSPYGKSSSNIANFHSANNNQKKKHIFV